MLKLDPSKMLPNPIFCVITHKDIDMCSSFLNGISFSFCLGSLKSLYSFLLVGSYWPHNVPHSGCVNPGSPYNSPATPCMYDLVSTQTENLLFQLVACLFTGSKTKDEQWRWTQARAELKQRLICGNLVCQPTGKIRDLECRAKSVTPTKNCWWGDDFA